MINEITAIIVFLGVFIANTAMIISLFLWNRAEARANARHTEAQLDSTRELVRAIQAEMKDFHERLLAIEENNLRENYAHRSVK